MIPSDREEVVREVKAKISSLKGDRARGVKVYATNCASCHRLAGQGHTVGPDLEAVRGRNKKALLVDLLDPSRAVEPSCQMYLVETASKEILSGLVVGETPSAVTLGRAVGEEQSVLRRDLGSVKAAAASMMPEGSKRT